METEGNSSDAAARFGSEQIGNPPREFNMIGRGKDQKGLDQISYPAKGAAIHFSNPTGFEIRDVHVVWCAND